RTMLQGYFGCLAAVDENVGRFLGKLDELKLAEKNVVIFTSDNGYYLGEHNLGDKRPAYKEEIRIPKLVCHPGVLRRKPGRTDDRLVLNLDIAPTILDLAGEKIPDSMQGRTWRRLFQSDVATGRDAFFYEYFYERPYAIPTVLAVRTHDAKLIKYPGHDDW